MEKLSNFKKEFIGRGHYQLTYTSHKTGKIWEKTSTDTMMIDEVFNAEYPTQKALNQLKKHIKA